MSYRSDLDATVVRAEVAEHRLVDVERKLDTLATSLGIVWRDAAVETHPVGPIPTNLEDAYAWAEAAEAAAVMMEQKLDELQRELGQPANPVPGRFVVERSDDTVRVRWRLFRWDDQFVALVLVLAIAVVGLVAAIKFDDPAAIALTCIAVPIVAYLVLALAFNHTTLTLTPHRVSTMHAPLPWPTRDVKREQLRGLEARDYTASTKLGNRFVVEAKLASGGVVTLVDRLRTLEEARFLVNLIGRHLAIPHLHQDA